MAKLQVAHIMPTALALDELELPVADGPARRGHRQPDGRPFDLTKGKSPVLCRGRSAGPLCFHPRARDRLAPGADDTSSHVALRRELEQNRQRNATQGGAFPIGGRPAITGAHCFETQQPICGNGVKDEGTVRSGPSVTQASLDLGRADRGTAQILDPSLQAMGCGL